MGLLNFFRKDLGSKFMWDNKKIKIKISYKIMKTLSSTTPLKNGQKLYIHLCVCLLYVIYICVLKVFKISKNLIFMYYVNSFSIFHLQ